MEISEITIKNFKGIEEIKIGPIKPINVLIGRNNSGKSSVLTCLQLLNKYFTAIGLSNQSRTIPPMTKMLDEYFRKDAGADTWFEISITVKQTKEEREKQFENAANNLNRLHTITMDKSKIAIQLERGLFGSITFDFRGIRDGEFGLISIGTTKEGKYENIAIEPNRHPGQIMRALAFLYLFAKGEIDEISKLVKEYGGGTKEYKGGFIELFIKEGCLQTKSETFGRFGEELLNPAFMHLKKVFKSTFMVSPYRHGEKIVHMHQRCLSLDENGSNIVNYLYNFFLNNHKIFVKVADFVKKIAPDVGRLHPQNPSASSSVQHPPQSTDLQLELAYEWPDGRVVNLANMGGGIEQLVILGSILLQQIDACVLVEEPESHLHPAAQDILLSNLEEYVGNSTIFMTTHSPVFVRSNDKIAVHIITNKDGKSGTGRTLSVTELQEAAIVIGSRPGHLAMADIVVYVEGKRGAEAFEEWLNKWPTRDKVLGHLLLSIWFLSPDDIGAKDFDLAPLRKVTQNMIMFVDKDNDEGSSEPKQSRKELQEKCKALGILCIITEKRQIEDYFTEDAVRQVLPSNILAGWKYEAGKPMNEQLPTKKYNAKIAAAMKWEDVAKHKDIMKVFEEIENFAKNLKPETNGE